MDRAGTMPPNIPWPQLLPVHISHRSNCCNVRYNLEHLQNILTHYSIDDVPICFCLMVSNVFFIQSHLWFLNPGWHSDIFQGPRKPHRSPAGIPMQLVTGLDGELVGRGSCSNLFHICVSLLEIIERSMNMDIFQVCIYIYIYIFIHIMIYV